MFPDSLKNYLFHKKIHLKIMTFISPNPNHYSKNSFKKPLRFEKSQPFNNNGRILFEGKSHINGKPIVIIATGFKEK